MNDLQRLLCNLFCVSILIVLLAGCMATHTAVTKRNLEVKTRMSETIFLEPMPKNKQVVYVRIRNTSGNAVLDLDAAIKEALQVKGFRVTDDPDEAYYTLQANVLSAGKMDDDSSLETSFGDAIIPGVLGGVIGNEADGTTGAVIGAVAGATVGFIGSAFVRDVTYSIITDVQIAQRVDPSALPLQLSEDQEDVPVENGWKKYTTRVASYANKVNLDYKKAEPQLVEELVRSIAGVL